MRGRRKRKRVIVISFRKGCNGISCVTLGRVLITTNIDRVLESDRRCVRVLFASPSG